MASESVNSINWFVATTDVPSLVQLPVSRANERSTEERLLNVLRSQLDEKDVALLKETLPRSLGPLPGEK